MKKSTKQLLDMLSKTNDFHSYAEENRESLGHMEISRVLCAIISEKGLKKSEVIAQSGLERHYAYQILSGVKQPSRDKVLMLCLGMKLTLDEVQRILTITSQPVLYAKNERDSAVIYGFMNGLSVIDLNLLLYDMGFELLT